jgi:hypothetical protein
MRLENGFSLTEECKPDKKLKDQQREAQTLKGTERLRDKRPLLAPGWTDQGVAGGCNRLSDPTIGRRQ